IKVSHLALSIPHSSFSPPHSPLLYTRLHLHSFLPTLLHTGIPAMPSTIHSGRATPGSSAVESQKLLVFLGAVFAFILTFFGLAKLVPLLRTWIRLGIPQSAASKGLPASTTPPPLYTFRTTGRGFPSPAALAAAGLAHMAFPKSRPQNVRTGVIQYIKAAPSLQHMTAPRVYALLHRRRLQRFVRPGPTPLRRVLTATHTARGTVVKSSVTLPVPMRAVRSQKPAPAAVISVRTFDHDRRHRTTEPLQAPHRPYLRQEEDKLESRSVEIPCLDGPDAEQLYRAAEGIVGAHPAALTLLERAAPVHRQRSFPWVDTTLEFGLVHAPFAQRSAPVHATAARPLSVNGGNGNAIIKKMLKSAARRSRNVGRMQDSGKENVA
ncbi:hypothetical protein C8R47DRAFT_1244689, partial [Mycena vitilis]